MTSPRPIAFLAEYDALASLEGGVHAAAAALDLEPVRRDRRRQQLRRLVLLAAQLRVLVDGVRDVQDRFPLTLDRRGDAAGELLIRSGLDGHAVDPIVTNI